MQLFYRRGGVLAVGEGLLQSILDLSPKPKPAGRPLIERRQEQDSNC